MLAAPIASAFEDDLKKIALTVAENVEKAKLKSVTVVDFADLQGKPTELGRFLAQEFSDKLVSANPSVAVVDRANVQFLLKESKLSAEGFIDPASSRKLGKLAGVDAIVIGTTTPVSEGYRLSVRAIGVDSGRVVSASSATIASTKELDQLYRRGVGTAAVTSPSAPATGSLSSRIRSESFKVEPRELIVHTNQKSGSLALAIQNVSGEPLSIGVLERSLLIGSCAPLRHAQDPRINLPYVRKRDARPRDLRELQANERMIVTGSFNTQDDSCITLREGVERATEVSFQMIVSDGNESVRFPLMVPAQVIRRPNH
jgi:TolB-like protein